jgi:hypothetical protein
VRRSYATKPLSERFMNNLSVPVTQQMLLALRERAHREGVTMADMVRRWMTERLREASELEEIPR